MSPSYISTSNIKTDDVHATQGKKSYLADRPNDFCYIFEIEAGQRPL
jgi:hypothetical protein